MRTGVRTICAATLAAIAVGFTIPARADSLVVKTAQGAVRGKRINASKVRAFLGIPYATPPLGNLRWKAPEPPTPWQGVRDASSFGARCEQWPIWKDYVFLDSAPSEDCLFLNVYTPAKSAHHLPVMFWIHGGGYTAGAGSEPRYTNSGLPLRDVILVTINYRLGVFGFLASKDLVEEGHGSAGNYGLMDMVAALHWVQANIERFGGDPGNVTIFGESAGSFAVSTLMASPKAQGLFQKAIGESGAPFGAVLAVDAVSSRSLRDQEWVDSLRVKDLAALRALPAAKLIDAARNMPVGWFSPVVDGHLVPQSVPQIYAAGKQAHVPLLLGWNRDERAGTLSKGMTVAKWKAFAQEYYGQNANEFISSAFPVKSDTEAVLSADAYTTDQFIAFGTWQWAEAQLKTGGAPVYRYHFELPAPPSDMHPEGKYAFHSDELEYVFGTLDTRGGTTWRPEDRKVSEEMMDYWTNFAKTGDPNGPGLPTWPRYDQRKMLLHLNAVTAPGPDTQQAEFDFLLKTAPPR